MQYGPKLGPIGERAARTIEEVRGCKVSRFGGDQAVVSAALDCGKSARHASPLCWITTGYSLNEQHKSRIALNDLLVD